MDKAHDRQKPADRTNRPSSSAVDIEAFAHNLARRGRGRRQGARRLHEAARGRQDQKRDRRRRDRRGQDHRPGHGILAVRSAARGRTAGEPRPRLSRPVGGRGQTHGRRRDQAGRRARPEGQALRRSGMVAEPVLRFPQAGLSAHRAMGRPAGARTPTASTRTRGRRRSSTSSRSPTRSRRRISCSPIPNCCARRSSSNAGNLVRGMHMLTEDIKAGHGNLKIRQSDARVFEVGRNLALTPGKVIFQNDLIQLIQYEATTKDVLKVPLLIVPPWINKFYILDLTPEKSFIKWCVDQGITVFVVSWVNPDASLATKSFEQYMQRRRDRRARRRRGSAPARSRSTPSAIASAARCWRSRSPISPPRSRRPRRSRPRCSPRRSISPMPAT